MQKFRNQDETCISFICKKFKTFKIINFLKKKILKSKIHILFFLASSQDCPLKTFYNNILMFFVFVYTYEILYILIYFMFYIYIFYVLVFILIYFGRIYLI